MRINCPTVSTWTVSIHLVRWVMRGSAAAHHQHLAVEVNRARFACGPWYAGNGGNRISHRNVFKGICSIGENAARDIAASTRVDEAADGRGGYVTQRNRQNRGLLHPDVSRGSKLPDLVGPVPSRDVESAQDIELVVEY